jgi:hypothetical protein
MSRTPLGSTQASWASCSSGSVVAWARLTSPVADGAIAGDVTANPDDFAAMPPSAVSSRRSNCAPCRHRVNWKQGDDVIIAGSVSNDEAKELFGDWDRTSASSHSPGDQRRRLDIQREPASGGFRAFGARKNGRVSDSGLLCDEIAGLRLGHQRAEERAAAVRDVVQTIARTTFDLDAVLQTVIDRAVELCRADNGNIARRDSEVYRVVAFTRFAPDFEQRVRERTTYQSAIR